MSTQTPTADQTRAPLRRATAWLLSTAVAAVAVATVTTISQVLERFHWWAGFVLLPGALIAAAGGPWLLRGGARAVGGYVVTCVGALVFTVGTLLMLGAMGDGWPIMISLPAAFVAGTYLWRPEHPLLRGLHRTVAMLALLTVLLGFTFLVLRAGWFYPRSGWWGAFMMAAGLIVAGNGVEVARHRMPYRLSAATLAFGPAVLTFLLGLRFLRGW
ncbi:hypothetical protein [Plantactinospora sp. GCM10030261]|uniref:hypothetical protein n=1 Tax=Plantactinospora sp. GCM10030261 TaxID=3273420 RepID=UPI003623B7BE